MWEIEQHRVGAVDEANQSIQEQYVENDVKAMQLNVHQDGKDENRNVTLDGSVVSIDDIYSCNICADLDIFWCRIKGSPWWPAQKVEESSDFYEERQIERTKAEKRNQEPMSLFQFFGGGKYTWYRNMDDKNYIMCWEKGFEIKCHLRKSKAFERALNEVTEVIRTSVDANLDIQWPEGWWNSPSIDEESEEETEAEAEAEAKAKAKILDEAKDTKGKKRSRSDSDCNDDIREKIWPTCPPNLSSLVHPQVGNHFIPPAWLRASIKPVSYEKISRNVPYKPTFNLKKKKLSKDFMPVCFCDAKLPEDMNGSRGDNDKENRLCPTTLNTLSNNQIQGSLFQKQELGSKRHKNKAKTYKCIETFDKECVNEDMVYAQAIAAQMPSETSRGACGIDCLNRKTRLVCNPAICPAGATCSNLAFHRLRSPKVKVMLTERCGWGVFAMETILPGQFIVEYVGELIDDNECERRLREAKAKSQTDFYMMQLHRDIIIDARNKGNFSRIINSSCSPNCETQMWTYAQNNEQHVGIFASSRIEPGTELSYDYKFEHFGLAASSSFHCQCGSKFCRGTLDQRPERKRNYGRKCQVLWDDNEFYSGVVIAYNSSNKKYKIQYEDGDIEDIDLRTVKHHWLPDDPNESTFKENYVDEVYGVFENDEDTKKKKTTGKKKEKVNMKSTQKIEMTNYGRRCKILKEDNRYYPGKVLSFNPSTRKYKIKYEDGATELMDLRTAQYYWLPDDPTIPSFKESYVDDINKVSSELDDKTAKATTTVLVRKGKTKNNLRMQKMTNYGRRCKIIWDDNKYYPGKIVQYNPLTKKYKIQYDDGDTEHIDLRSVKFKWLPDDPSVPSSKELYVNDLNKKSIKVEDEKNRKMTTNKVVINSDTTKLDRPGEMTNYGRRCEIMWDDNIYYRGKVVSFNPSTRKYKIQYDDGDKEHITLSSVKYRWLPDDTSMQSSRENCVDKLES